jgi:hypothetical protein
MLTGTSPSITALPIGSTSGYEIALQANTGDLWNVGFFGTTTWSLGMAAGTNPAVANG